MYIVRLVTKDHDPIDIVVKDDIKDITIDDLFRKLKNQSQYTDTRVLIMEKCECHHEGKIIDKQVTKISDLTFEDIPQLGSGVVIIAELVFKDETECNKNNDGSETRGLFPVTPSDEFLAFTTKPKDGEVTCLFKDKDGNVIRISRDELGGDAATASDVIKVFKEKEKVHGKLEPLFKKEALDEPPVSTIHSEGIGSFAREELESLTVNEIVELFKKKKEEKT